MALSRDVRGHPDSRRLGHTGLDCTKLLPAVAEKRVGAGMVDGLIAARAGIDKLAAVPRAGGHQAEVPKLLTTKYAKQPWPCQKNDR